MSTDQEDRAEFERQFGETIKRERQRRGWTADEAARLAGIAPKTWQRLEDGKMVRNKTFQGVDALFGMEDGTAVRVFIDGGDLQGELARVQAAERAHDNALPEGVKRVIEDSQWVRNNSRRMDFARYMISEHRRISGRGKRAALFDLLVVAVNELQLEDLDHVQKIIEVARIARVAELRIDPDFANAAMIVPDIPDALEGSIEISNTAHVGNRKLAEVMVALGEELAVWGDDGER